MHNDSFNTDNNLFFSLVSTPTPISIEDVRIVGGDDIDISEAPYQVSLVNKGRHSCGGTIISEDIIVTAAHCIYGYLFVSNV